MRSTFRDVDRLLRGGFTSREDLAQGRFEMPTATLMVAGLILGGIYGAFMGLYGVLRPENPSYLQLLATTVKVPLLFLLTLGVTFPSLYVFSALSRSRLDFSRTLRLLLAAIAVNLAVLASFGPVTGFFTLSTESYPFMVVLNVLFFAASGVVGVGFLRRTLLGLFGSPMEALTHDASPAKSAAEPGASATKAIPAPDARLGREREVASKRTRGVLPLWVVIYGCVGAQMGWILRPFVGTPEHEFTLFRARESNFFEAFFRALGSLFS